VAVYQGGGKRKRATILVAVATAIAGLVIGIVIGRATAPSVNDKIADGRKGGQELATALQVLPLEYGQALNGSEGTTLIGDTVNRALAQLNTALDGAPWLGPGQRRQATQAVQAVRTAATNKVPLKRFQTIVDSSSATIETVFGLPPSRAG
jgi:hypothetical protein